MRERYECARQTIIWLGGQDEDAVLLDCICSSCRDDQKAMAMNDDEEKEDDDKLVAHEDVTLGKVLRLLRPPAFQSPL